MVRPLSTKPDKPRTHAVEGKNQLLSSILYCMRMPMCMHVLYMYIYTNRQINVKNVDETFAAVKIFTGDLSPAELMLLTIGDVIKQLIDAHEHGRDIDLNK